MSSNIQGAPTSSQTQNIEQLNKDNKTQQTSTKRALAITAIVVGVVATLAAVFAAIAVFAPGCAVGSALIGTIGHTGCMAAMIGGSVLDVALIGVGAYYLNSSKISYSEEVQLQNAVISILEPKEYTIYTDQNGVKTQFVKHEDGKVEIIKNADIGKKEFPNYKVFEYSTTETPKTPSPEPITTENPKAPSPEPITTENPKAPAAPTQEEKDKQVFDSLENGQIKLVLVGQSKYRIYIKHKSGKVEVNDAPKSQIEAIKADYPSYTEVKATELPKNPPQDLQTIENVIDRLKNHLDSSLPKAPCENPSDWSPEFLFELASFIAEELQLVMELNDATKKRELPESLEHKIGSAVKILLDKPYTVFYTSSEKLVEAYNNSPTKNLDDEQIQAAMNVFKTELQSNTSLLSEPNII